MSTVLSYIKKHPEVIWLAVIMTLSTLLRMAFLHEPFDRDEGHYAAIAQEILRGGLPYRDAIEIKPPGTFYLYAAAIGLFGATTEAVRIFTALYALMTLFAVYKAAEVFAGRRGGLLAAAIYGIFSTAPLLQGSNSNMEVFLVLPMTAGFWCLLKACEAGRRPYLFGVGMCAALSLLIKPVALPVVLAELAVVPFIRSGPQRWKETAADMLLILGTLLFAAMAVFGYFWLRGGIADIFYWTVEAPMGYRESDVNGIALAGAVQILKYSLMVPVLLGIFAALRLAAGERGIKAKLPLLVICAATVAVLIPGKNFAHYFILPVPFLSIAAGAGLAHVPQWRRMPAAAALLVIFVLIAVSVGKNIKYYTAYSPQAVSAAKHGAIFLVAGDVARYLREHTRPGDYIFQWGFEPELYFLADRRFPNPYLVSLFPGWARDPGRAVSTLRTSLYEKRATYIVVQKEWADFPGEDEIAEIVRGSYHLDVIMGNGANQFYLYRRTGS